MTTMLLPLLAALAAAALLPPARAGSVLLYPYGHCLNSHLLAGEKLADILLAAGHNVTMLVSSDYAGFEHHQGAPPLAPRPALRLLSFPGPANYTPICAHDTPDFMMHSPLQERFDAFTHTAVRYCDALLAAPGLLGELRAARFQLLVVEALDPCSRILADFLHPTPFIPLLTAGLGHWDGNVRLASHLPAAIAPFSQHMTFMQRVGNLVMKSLYDAIPIIMGFDENFERLKVKYDLNTSVSLSTTFDRAALKFINSDFAIEYPAPIGPDTIMIGGFAVSPPKPLNDELDEFMWSAGSAGVIVMSTGTLVKQFDKRWTDMFLKAFASLPQKIIWRNAAADLNSTLAPNVKIMSWLPQRDLLAHPQTCLFITHCGLNALHEVTASGVPVIAAPMSGDQLNNAAKLTAHAGMGVKVDMFSLTPELLRAAIVEVLTKPHYTAAARHIAKLVNDKPMTSSETVAYWADYVIRHSGAGHLQPGGRHLSRWQYFSLDVIAFLIGVACVVVGLLGGLLVCAAWSLSHYCRQQKLKQC